MVCRRRGGNTAADTPRDGARGLWQDTPSQQGSDPAMRTCACENAPNYFTYCKMYCKVGRGVALKGLPGAG